LVCIALFDRILQPKFNFSVEYFYAATCDHSPQPSNTAFFRSDEIAHNDKYVFAISSRFNANDSVKRWKEADDIVTRNRAVNAPHLQSE
jgi:hypothetical protein